MAAAAAAAAACELIECRRGPSAVLIKTPDGRLDLEIDVEEVSLKGRGASAAVVKRAGPDIDATDGLAIEVEVQPLPGGRVYFEAGPGVGRVTRPGLAVPVGQAAINPMPRAHIEHIVGSRLGGARVTVGARGGASAARKTFNPRLGIVGGISILGTSGLVRPMSLAAWKSALLPQLDQAAALGHKTVALAPGNLGASAAAKLGLAPTAVVQMGNFAAFMMRAAAERGLDFLVVGHLGKLAKIACGHEDTHHANTPDRLLLIERHLREIDPHLATAAAREAATAEEISAFLLKAAPRALSAIAEKVLISAGKMGSGRCRGAVITNLSGAAIGAFPPNLVEELL